MESNIDNILREFVKKKFSGEKITKPFSRNFRFLACSMTDRPTDKRTVGYRKSSQKISCLSLTADEKITFPRKRYGLTF